MTAGRTFDRSRDVPKLVGCNTRNVPYRWAIYERHLGSVPLDSNVLDFGAGSLRETFDLAERGYRVTAVDLDLELMRSSPFYSDEMARRLQLICKRFGINEEEE